MTALVSIGHRMAGIIVFLVIPLLLWALQKSLASPESFNQLYDFFQPGIWQVILWISLSAFVFHLLAGFRHLLMDIHLGGALKIARLSAFLVLMSAGAIIIALAIWLWGRGL
jgi:succinate dehydrogenase / fumarate reductase cytochrome b subunit